MFDTPTNFTILIFSNTTWYILIIFASIGYDTQKLVFASCLKHWDE